MFLGRCAEQARPQIERFLGTQDEATQGAESPPAAQAVTLQGVRIASWNLEWLHEPGRGTVARNKRDYERLAHYAESMRADLFAVQEVASEFALSLVFPPERYAMHLAQKGNSQRSGFVWRRDLNVTVHPDVDELAIGNLRAGADVSLRIGEHELRLLSLHLKAYCATGPIQSKDEDCKRLAAQLPALEAWVDARARENTPFVVLGDFNRTLRDNDPLLEELDDHEPANLTLLRATPVRKAACASGRNDAVDHVLLGGVATTWLVKNSFRESTFLASDVAQDVKLSDHCPLSVELKLPAR